MLNEVAANWMVKGKVLADYLEACKTADLNNFKRDPRLTKIFEHTSIEQGKAYLNHILKTDSKVLDNIFTNDLQGNPVIYDWGNGLYMSPSTLQYVAVLNNLIDKFGRLDFKSIVEVGGGYGGQCKTILDIYAIKRYCIVDLVPVLNLQSAYLKNNFIEYHDGPAVGGELDLFISNYALSEIPRNEHFIELASKCKHGYITCNTDFVKLPWKHERTPDITGEPNNYILSW